MEFRSKGLGKRMVALRLSKAKTVKSGDKLYISGTMDEPIKWDYMIVLDGGDIADFVGLLGERHLADYIWHSPDRWRLYRTLLTGGSRFALLVARARIHLHIDDTQPVEPTIQVPPPRDRKRRNVVTRRRLGARRDAAKAAGDQGATQGPDAGSHGGLDSTAGMEPPGGGSGQATPPVAASA